MTPASHSAGHSKLLVVFVKHPEPGRVKTRLATGVGEARAAEIYGELVMTTFAAIRKWLGGPDRQPNRPEKRFVWIYFDPPEQEVAVRAWLNPLVAAWASPPAWVAQPYGDLGHRLQTVFNQGFQCGFYGIYAIGSDCPYLTANDLEDAFEGVDAEEVVLGPAADGGYYGIALKKECKSLFTNIPWSSNQTFSTTCTKARQIGWTIRVLRELEDVDTEVEWRRWKGK